MKHFRVPPWDALEGGADAPRKRKMSVDQGPASTRPATNDLPPLQWDVARHRNGPDLRGAGSAHFFVGPGGRPVPW
jgi:hypothetical protein